MCIIPETCSQVLMPIVFTLGDEFWAQLLLCCCFFEIDKM